VITQTKWRRSLKIYYSSRKSLRDKWIRLVNSETDLSERIRSASNITLTIFANWNKSIETRIAQIRTHQFRIQ
jgi:hypothetical protein